MKDDVHELRGISLKGIRRDPGYFLKGYRMEQADLEECFDARASRGKTPSAMEQADLEECFDADTLFYDVFFEPTNRHLVAVGPPLGNLQLDLKLYVNGEPIGHTMSRRAAKRSYLVRGEVSRVERLNDIVVQANGQRGEVRVPENNSGTGYRFTLCTLQKNNREHWIRDWIEHYRKMGVDRVIIYDHNSEKLPDVDAIVIPCPYKYGFLKSSEASSLQVRRTNFLQRSLLTICGYKYRSGHLLNFDIDELLQVESLEKYRERKIVYFDSYFVETRVDRKLPTDYSFRHFVYRNAQMRNRSYKYLVKMEEMLYSRDPHWAVLKGNFAPRKIILKIWKICSYLRSQLPKRLRAKMALQDKDVFYHYKGISTGWRVDKSSFDDTTEIVRLEDSQL